MLSSAKKKQLGGAHGSGDTKLLGTGDDFVERKPSALRMGDIVQYRGVDYLVEGVVHYDEDGHRWLAGRLIDGRDIKWLFSGLVRAGSEQFHILSTTELAGYEYPPDALHHGGNHFSLDRRGTATARMVGDTGGVGRGQVGSVIRCRWWRYDAPGDKCLLLEQWSGDMRALVGEAVAPGELEMIPGS